MKNLKTYIWLFIIINVTLGYSDSDKKEEQRTLFKCMYRRGDVYEWNVSLNKIQELPFWDDEKEKIPLDMQKAIKIAKNWMSKTYGKDQYRVASFVMCPIHRDYQANKSRFFYRISFYTGMMERKVCIVLFDGTVVEPKPVKMTPDQYEKSMDSLSNFE